MYCYKYYTWRDVIDKTETPDVTDIYSTFSDRSFFKVFEN